jgi:DNA-binding CsgD family transcriptional regulator
MAYRLGRDRGRSRQFLEEGLALYRELGDRAGQAYAFLNLGVTLWGQGDLAGSRRFLEQGLTLYRDEGDIRHIAIAQAVLGRTVLQEGEPRRAAGLLAEALAGHWLVGDRFFVFYDLLGLAAVLAAQARPTHAAQLLGAAWALGNVPGDALTDAAAHKYGPVIDVVRARLNEAEFARAWAAGQAMSLEQAIQHARAAGEPAPAPARVCPTPASPGAPELLTAREREVAALIGQGCRTDHQLAERLTITAATAAVHVRNIREKLGFHSRWQIADWARAHGLTHVPR